MTSLDMSHNRPRKLLAERFPPIVNQETSKTSGIQTYLPRRGQVFQEELNEYRES